MLFSELRKGQLVTNAISYSAGINDCAKDELWQWAVVLLGKPWGGS